MNSIKCKRESAGWTQARLARELGISRATVAMWETGKSRPRYDMLPKIARLLGCTIDELYADEPEKEAG
ncbi:helix-turn-helix transcriptional regulator [uncultured Agathobaculum sp.]|uniref:helix-turn-helix transcriptional regulator n=1 Tax=uncultured Agathobaculum sp. TaxID=2048140 RepID=UPI003209E9FA